MSLTPDNAQEIAPAAHVMKQTRAQYLDATQGPKNCGHGFYGEPTARENRRWRERKLRGKRERVKVESKGFG